MTFVNRFFFFFIRLEICGNLLFAKGFFFFVHYTLRIPVLRLKSVA
jgi:hypothetical protein